MEHHSNCFSLTSFLKSCFGTKWYRIAEKRAQEAWIFLYHYHKCNIFRGMCEWLYLSILLVHDWYCLSSTCSLVFCYCQETCVYAIALIAFFSCLYNAFSQINCSPFSSRLYMKRFKIGDYWCKPHINVNPWRYLTKFWWTCYNGNFP